LRKKYYARFAALNARGDENILVVDDLASDEKWKNLVGLKYDDYMDRETFRKSVHDNRQSNISAIFHMGACSSTTEPQNAPAITPMNARLSASAAAKRVREVRRGAAAPARISAVARAITRRARSRAVISFLCLQSGPSWP
jgi:hypothetical protein